jgi:hypothetical protein
MISKLKGLKDLLKALLAVQFRLNFPGLTIEQLQSIMKNYK